MAIGPDARCKFADTDVALAGRDHAVEVRVGRVDCRSGRMARPPPQVRRERSLAKVRGRCRSSAARCRRARPSWPFPPDPTGPSLTGGHSALTMSAASGRTLEPRAPSHGPASSRTMRPVTTPCPASARPVRWLIGLGLAFGTAMRCVAAEQSVQLSSPVPYAVFQRSALVSHGRSRRRSSLRPCPPRKRRVHRQDSAQKVRTWVLLAPVPCPSGLYPSRRRISSGGWSAMPRLVARPTSTVKVVTPDNAIANGTGNAAKS